MHTSKERALAAHQARRMRPSAAGGRTLSCAVLCGLLAATLYGKSAFAEEVPTGGGESKAPAAAPKDDAAEQKQPDKDDRVESGSGLFEQGLSEPAETSAASSSAGGAASPGPSESSAPYELNGYVRGDVFVGRDPVVDEPMAKAAYGELALKLRVKKQAHGDAYAEARIRYGELGGPRQVALDLREAYVNLYFGPLDLRLGQQIIVWGRADAVNPTNNITPVDLRVRSPQEDDRRMGNVGARAFLNFSPLRIEGIWMPVYVPSELPNVVMPSYVTLTSPNIPNAKLRNGLEAGRVHLEFAAFEMSASYLHGYAPLPGLSLRDFSVGPDYRVNITRTPYEQHVVGFDFSTVLANWLGVRGEAAYRYPVQWRERVNAPRPDVQYVAGLDHTFGSLSIIAQYIGRYTFDWALEKSPEPQLDPTMLAGLSSPVPTLLAQTITNGINQELRVRNQILFSQRAEIQHMASLRIELLAFHDTLSLSALGAFNATTKEWLVYPKVAYQASDSMSLTLGGEMYAGPEQTLFGLIDRELTAGYFEAKFSF